MKVFDLLSTPFLMRIESFRKGEGWWAKYFRALKDTDTFALSFILAKFT